MVNKEKIDTLLTNIQELEKRVVAIRETLEKMLEEETNLPAPPPEVASAIATEANLIEKLLPQATIEVEQPQQTIIEVNPPIEQPQQTATPTPLIGDRPGISLHEILEKKNLSDFRKAFSLNDRFRFRRDLFGGDESRMNQAISELNDIQTYEDSITYLHQVLKWNIEDEAIADFIQLLEKRFL